MEFCYFIDIFTNMKEIISLINSSEEWLIERVLEYAKRQNYTKYTSTLKEAWRLSIQELSKVLCGAIESGLDAELTPDESYTDDHGAAFGNIEAKLHRERGISFPMFMGLFKYYIQSYKDLIDMQGFPPDLRDRYIVYISRVFDRIEIAFSTEWVNLSGEDKLGELQDTNRRMTNEKNMYLTVVESLTNPIVFLDSAREVAYINKSASGLLKLSGIPGGYYYNREALRVELPQWLREHADNFFVQGLKEMNFEAVAMDDEIRRYYQGCISLMEDVSGKFSGAVLILNDITELKDAGDRIKNLLAERELILKEVHHRIKNNMSTIKFLLFLQEDSLKDPAAVSALRDAENRVDSMMVLYDKLYRSENFHEVSVKNYILSLIDEIVFNFPNSQSVVIEKEIDDFDLDVKKLQPLGIIINELLTNMMKYAFTGINNGLISVSATLKGDTVSLIIQDDGIGIPESIDFENTASFGLKLVGMLTKQFGGSIRIERGEGTKFILEFIV